MRAAICCAVLSAASVALANGRAPATSTIHFQRGAEQNVIAGMTFGLLTSHDGGRTWTWTCETAVGYGGTYDPAYAYTRAGTLFATTFNGLAVERDGCSFDLVPQTTCQSAKHCTFVSSDDTSGSGAFYYAAADPHDSSVYRSLDDGSAFEKLASPAPDNTWWQRIAVAPSDGKRVYLVGYRTTNTAPREFYYLVSRDGGATFQPMAGGGAIATINSSIVGIAAVDPRDPDALYISVEPQALAQVPGDGGLQRRTTYGLWRTSDAGATFTQIFTSEDAQIAVVARRNRELVVATQPGGVRVSRDRGTTWSPPLAGAPHVNCLTENSAGEVWACTLNYPTQTLPSDGAGIMKTTDLATWTKVLRFQDIEPATCAAGTVQHDTCVEKEWCTLAQQLQVTSKAIACPPPSASAAPAPPPARPADPRRPRSPRRAAAAAVAAAAMAAAAGPARSR